jgi:hypothetical protein
MVIMPIVRIVMMPAMLVYPAAMPVMVVVVITVMVVSVAADDIDFRGTDGHCRRSDYDSAGRPLRANDTPADDHTKGDDGEPFSDQNRARFFVHADPFSIRRPAIFQLSLFIDFLSMDKTFTFRPVPPLWAIQPKSRC